MIPRWHWAGAVIGVIIIILVLSQGVQERSVSNIYVIPGGTFVLFHETNKVADNADAGNQSWKIIPISISNNASDKSYLQGTTRQEIKPFASAPSSTMKKIEVPKLNESSEKHNEIFSDRDWAFIRKSMTDLTEKDQDRLITEMKKILGHTSSLSPDEQANVSLRMGYYIINATEGGKPVNSSDLPELPAEIPA